MQLGLLLKRIRQALQTPLCLECGTDTAIGQSFCAPCLERLGVRPAKPLVQTAAFAAYAAATLTPALKRRLYSYKFYNHHDYAPLLAELLIHYWEGLQANDSACFANKRIHPEQTLVIPIPPHTGSPSRVDAFAREFARQFEYDYQPDLLYWSRSVSPQHHLADKHARLKNVAQSLEVARPDLLTDYRHFVMIDDLTTTGATLREAVRALYAGFNPNFVALDTVESGDKSHSVFQAPFALSSLDKPSLETLKNSGRQRPRVTALAIASVPLGSQG
jgi:predicted amidophosphoribosyltransferase